MKNEIKRGSVVKVKLSGNKFFRGIILRSDKTGETKQHFVSSKGAGNFWPENMLIFEFQIEGKKDTNDYYKILDSLIEFC